MQQTSLSDDHDVNMLRETILGLVRVDVRDLSARQLAVFLICYLDETAQTVRGLANQLKVPKAAVTRALDRPAEDALVIRKPDPADRRSIVVGRTAGGNRFLRDVKAIMRKAA